MAKEDFLGKGLAFPFSVEGDVFAWSAGERLIRESIEIILGTAKGERVMRPDFGCNINGLVFEVNSSSTMTMVAFHVKEALRKWEPRIEVTDVTVKPSEEEKERMDINIEYIVKDSNTKRNLVYPFYLEV